MLGWLNSLLNRFTGGLSVIWNSFINVLQVVYGNLSNSVNDGISYAQAVAAYVQRLSGDFNSFIVHDYNTFVTWTANSFSNLQGDMQRGFDRMQQIVDSFHNQDQQAIGVVQENLSNGLSGLIQWVIQHIFDPLFSDIGGLLAWLARWGNWLVDILTHLEKLADLIMAFLWSGWLVLFQKYAKQIVVFIFQNWKSWIPSLLPIIEDIISAIMLTGQVSCGRYLKGRSEARP